VTRRRLGVGIDTGGTYTDAVLVDLDTMEVLASAKEATRPHDLGGAVTDALGRLWTAAPQEPELLALSTTLATNAVVEGRGGRVALFVIGYVRHFRLPLVANVFLRGGHDIHGKEVEPLDLEGLVDTVQGLRGEVDAYAVCSAMAMHNPTHELVARRAIEMLDPRPVFCSHEFSSIAGMRERAATTALHARLLPLMEAFQAALRRGLTRLGFGCEVRLVCGDTGWMRLEDSARFAAATMASGPAATGCFGARQGCRSALVVDVGGTAVPVVTRTTGQATGLPPEGTPCVVSGMVLAAVPGIENGTGARASRQRSGQAPSIFS